MEAGGRRRREGQQREVLEAKVRRLMFSANGRPRSIPASEVGIIIAFKIAVGVATNPRAGSLRGDDPDDRRIFGPIPDGHRPHARLPIDVECGSASDRCCRKRFFWQVN